MPKPEYCRPEFMCDLVSLLEDTETALKVRREEIARMLDRVRAPIPAYP